MIRSIDPRRGEPFGPDHPHASEAEVSAAVAAAVAAAGRLAGVDPAGLASGLDAVAVVLQGEASRLAVLADEETGLGVARLEGEVGRTTSQLRAFAALVRSGAHLGNTLSRLGEGAPARQLRRTNVPVGVVAVFAASNFPFAFSVAGGDTASALAAGCPVVVKAHYGHPQTSTQVAHLARVALSGSGLPPDALQVLHGDAETGRLLVRHPDVAAVGFTGSAAGGRAIYDLAAQREEPIPVYAEQGSVNPVVLAPSALADVGGEARMLGESVALGGGQFCTKPGIVLVPAEHRDSLVAELIQALAGSGPFFLLTGKILDSFERAVARASQVPGVQIWRGESSGAGYQAAPAVLAASSALVRHRSELREEIFGPAVVVVGVDDVEDLRRTLPTLGGNLTGAVHGSVTDSWTTTAVEILARQVGRLVYGGVPTGVAVDPAMMHGGPYPASTSARDTSVGTAAVYRFLRPVTYQDFPPGLLPAGLRMGCGD